METKNKFKEMELKTIEWYIENKKMDRLFSKKKYMKLKYISQSIRR